MKWNWTGHCGTAIFFLRASPSTAESGMIVSTEILTTLVCVSELNQHKANFVLVPFCFVFVQRNVHTTHTECVSCPNAQFDDWNTVAGCTAVLLTYSIFTFVQRPRVCLVFVLCMCCACMPVTRCYGYNYPSRCVSGLCLCVCVLHNVRCVQGVTYLPASEWTRANRQPVWAGTFVFGKQCARQGVWGQAKTGERAVPQHRMAENVIHLNGSVFWTIAARHSIAYIWAIRVCAIA